MKEIQVGLIGLGTVGCGLVKVLEDNSEMLKERLGVPLRLKRVVDIDLERSRPVSLPRKILSTQVEDILADEEIRIVVELIG
ncbi:MAG: homoserine dehydrogenase, partial [Desulfatiglandales bacterium]